MRFHRLVLAAVAALGCSLAGAQQQDFSKVEIRAEKITDNLHVLFGVGGNMALLTGPDGAVLVDDQMAPLAPKIRAAIALLTDRPVRFVLNTHWHFDHAGGNEAFGKTGAIIMAHENTRKRLSTPQVVQFFKVETPASPAEALPVVTFEDGATLHLNGETLVARHFPNAHTDTDIVLRFEKARAVHMGDIFMNGFYPFIDEGSGGTFDGVIAVMDTVLAETDDEWKIIPGHGPLASRADLQATRDMLVTVRERIVKLIRQGRTQEQVLAAQPTREFDAKYGVGMLKPDVWVQRVYVDLKRAQQQKKR